MKETLYLYSPKFLFEIIKDMLLNYNIIALTNDEINNNNFKNNNTLLVLKGDGIKNIKKSFFFKNNILVFLTNKHELPDIIKSNKVRFFHGHASLKKLHDEVRTFFITKTIILNNIEMLGEKITNISSGQNFLLTELEKKILIVLFENKEVKRDYLLEVVLKIKKNIETKTLESHLTRIRRKLLSIKSKIYIKSKEDIFYLDI